MSNKVSAPRGAMPEAADSDEHDDSLLWLLTDALLAPFRIAASKPARRLYLRTTLLFTATLLLVILSIVASIAFYNIYIPHRAFSVPLHLQFDPERIQHPYAIAPLSVSGSVEQYAEVVRGGGSSPIVSEQRYDVSVQLRLPRSEKNLEAGNFMIKLTLLAAAEDASAGVSGGIGVLNEDTEDRWRRLAVASRPTILRYRSPIVSNAGTIGSLPILLLGWSSEEETLLVPMLEGWTAKRGWRNRPTAVKVELLSAPRTPLSASRKAQHNIVDPRRDDLMVYDITVHFKAHFTGLRYLLSTYRIISFLAFTSLFFLTSLLSAVTIWVILANVFPTKTIKDVNCLVNEKTGDLRDRAEKNLGDIGSISDTSAAFPTFSKQPPLKYSHSEQMKKEEDYDDAKIKHEDDEDGAELFREGATADDERDDYDEDEDADFVLDSPNTGLQSLYDGGARSDSGLGTSLESSNDAFARGDVRRRRSKGPSDDAK